MALPAMLLMSCLRCACAFVHDRRKEGPSFGRLTILLRCVSPHPLLFPQPFPLGTLRPLRVHVKRAPLLEPSGNRQGDDAKHSHSLRVEGPVLPCRMQALVHALMSSGRHDDFNVQYTTDARTLGLNGAVDDEQREVGVPGEVLVVQRVRRSVQGLFLTTGSVAG